MKCFYFILRKYLKIYLNLFIQKVDRGILNSLLFFITKENNKCKLNYIYI